MLKVLVSSYFTFFAIVVAEDPPRSAYDLPLADFQEEGSFKAIPCGNVGDERDCCKFFDSSGYVVSLPVLNKTGSNYCVLPCTTDSDCTTDGAGSCSVATRKFIQFANHTWHGGFIIQRFCMFLQK